MISAVCLGFFATGCALVGMKCTKIGGSDQVKARIACFAGFQFFVSGLCSLTACSLYAHRITSEFFDPMFMAQKYELGAALFIGWGGSALCILGGIVFFLSLSDGISKSSSQADKRRYLYSAASYVSSPGKMHNQSANGYVQAVRGLLLFGMATGFFAAILCFIGMDCTNIGGNERTNDKILLTGAVFHFLGGMADAAGYCLFTARLGKATFARLAGRGVVRYEIGSPIYLGLVGSFCIIMGSIFYAVSVYRFFLPNRELDVPGPRKDMAPQIYVPLTKNETLFKGENNAATQSRPSSLSSIQASGTSRSTETSDRDAFV
ncbi:uncharacterized protein LOC113585667 isoform X4 [Electrophorus electricus]|nr:uncharacterized protein LOC113585667 isoform X4 [Electrophorus electricus]XP_026879110.1 uncharacterized protein LOC113585667 isoform X4 [Electrophorus electricus]XP_026879112.1 uncharacterized protein LOC113585667 isoform X4 [Electrophorus electricus]XP_026879113.1 uncharacterized protein LOC113585667 isoform X4 [Electrophorus electricus]